MQRVAPPAIPLDPAAVVVLPLDDQMPVTLFPDEASLIRRHVADQLARRGIAVVPIDEVLRIEQAAAEGQLVFEEDQHCRAPLLPGELRQRYFDTQPHAVVQAHCMDTCTLEVYVDTSGDGETNVAFVSRAIHRPHDPRAWAKASLRPSQHLVWGGIGGLFGSSHPPPMMFGWPQSIGPWRQPPTSELFDALEPTVAGCAHDDPMVGLGWMLRIAVAPDGRVSRCAATSVHSMATASNAECMCRGVETLDFGKGPAGRRLRVDAVDDGSHRFAEYELTPLQPGTKPWVRRLDESGLLDACVSRGALPKDATATMVLHLAPDGGVDDAEVFGQFDDVESMRVGMCLVKRLRAMDLPCRPPGIDTLQVQLTPRAEP